MMDSAALLTLLASIIVALATAFFSSRFYVFQAKADLEKELKKEFESRFNERKWEAYTGFADIVRETLQSSRDQKLKQKLPQLTSRLYEFTSKLWLVGSDSVVDAVVDWQRYSRKADPQAQDNPIEALVILVQILIEMRLDLGYTGSKLRPQDILATFVTDIDKYYPE